MTRTGRAHFLTGSDLTRPCWLESIIQAVLNQARSDAIARRVLRSDPAESRVVYVVIVAVGCRAKRSEVGVIENVEEVRVKLQRLSFGDSEILHHGEIIVPVRRPIERALLQRSLRAGLRIEKQLPGKRRCTVGRHPARIGTDMRRVQPVWAITVHEKTGGGLKLANGRRSVHRILSRLRSPIDGAARRQNRHRTSGLNDAKTA